MARKTKDVNAEILALRAFAALGAREDALERFIQASGVAPRDLAARIQERAVQSAILEFLLANEDLLLEVCEAAAIEPGEIHRAQHLLEN